MPYTITTDVKRRVLWLAYHGRMTIDERREAVSSIALSLTELGYRRVLVDLREAVRGFYRPEDEDEFASFLVEKYQHEKPRIAYLSHADVTFNSFIELMVKVRGAESVHFTGEERALQWLVEFDDGAG